MSRREIKSPIIFPHKNDQMASAHLIYEHIKHIRDLGVHLLI